MKKKRILITTFISVLILLTSVPSRGEDISKYPVTVAVLQQLYADEVVARRTLLTYARTALSENLPGVARLFFALHAAEAIHARNFGGLLEDLGEKVPVPSEVKIHVSGSKENLQHTLVVELAEIDNKYPLLLERVKGENYEPAIKDITYAWKAEQHHRDLVKKMQSALPFFFRQIARKLKGTDNYFVCQRCGSTLMELPKQVCPICGNPVSLYKKIDITE